MPMIQKELEMLFHKAILNEIESEFPTGDIERQDKLAKLIAKAISQEIIPFIIKNAVVQIDAGIVTVGPEGPGVTVAPGIGRIIA